MQTNREWNKSGYINAEIGKAMNDINLVIGYKRG